MTSMELQKKWMRLYERVYGIKSTWIIQPKFGRVTALTRLDELGLELCIVLVNRGFIPGTGWYMRNLSPWTMSEPFVTKGIEDAFEAIGLTRHPERYLPTVDAKGRIHDSPKPSADVLGIAELFYIYSSDYRDFLPEARTGWEHWQDLMRARRVEADEIRDSRQAAQIAANPLNPKWYVDVSETLDLVDRLPDEVRDVVLAEMAGRRDAREASRMDRASSA